MSIAPVDQVVAVPAPVRCSPVPVREPHPAVRVDRPADRPGQIDGQTPLTLVLPGTPRPGTGARDASAGDPGPGGREVTVTRIEGRAGSGPDRTGIYPEPQAWAVRFVLAALEVSHGVRPADQLVRWTSPEVYATLARRGGLAARLRPSRPAGMVSGALRVLRVRCCEPAPAICEVAVVVRDRDRIRAAALRLEGLGNRWRVTDLQIG